MVAKRAFRSYIPARAAWGPDVRLGPSPSPVYEYGQPEAIHPTQSPSPVHAYGQDNRAPQPMRSNLGNDDYYEDMEPRFADKSRGPTLPSALMPGPAGEPKPKDSDDLPEAPGSPTTSEISHFTSISQRPINPRWQPPPAPLKPAQQRTNMLLENNPDFDLQAGRRKGGAGPGGRMPTLSMVREAPRYPIP